MPNYPSGSYVLIHIFNIYKLINSNNYVISKIEAE